MLLSAKPKRKVKHIYIPYFLAGPSEEARTPNIAKHPLTLLIVKNLCKSHAVPKWYNLLENAKPGWDA